MININVFEVRWILPYSHSLRRILLSLFGPDHLGASLHCFRLSFSVRLPYQFFSHLMTSPLKVCLYFQIPLTKGPTGIKSDRA